MSTKDKPAFPSCGADGRGPSGMTLHQWFAGMALQGLLACTNTSTTFEGFASDSLKYADAIIAEYEKRQKL